MVLPIERIAAADFHSIGLSRRSARVSADDDAGDEATRVPRDTLTTPVRIYDSEA